MADDSGPVLPDYGGASLDAVVPAVLGRFSGTPDWFPRLAAHADQVVLLVLDGLGWLQLRQDAASAPTLTAMEGGPITTVAPSTTATALTSLTTGKTPAHHGVVGYRVRVRRDEVLNVLRWKTAAGDARATVPPETFQPLATFGGTSPPVVTRAEFTGSGFTGAHLNGARLYGWRMPSTLVVTVSRLLAAGERFIYAYYDGVDKVAHEFGLGREYRAEVAAADGLVNEVINVLPAGAALVVVSDHGQVDVGNAVVPLDAKVVDLVTMLSGEGRFRWLHARPGMQARLLQMAQQCHGGDAWVATREAAVKDGWFGGDLDDGVASRLGDVVLAARRPVAFLDPADTGDMVLRSRHGSLTQDEMLVPLLAAAP